MARNPYGVNRGMDKKEIRDRVQQGTRVETVEMLKQHNMALIVRPTGFGKTFTLLDIAYDVIHDKNLNGSKTHEGKRNKILFIYPTKIIRQSVISDYFNPLENIKEKPWKMKCVLADDAASYKKCKMTSEECQRKFPDLPVIDFCTYSKFGLDFSNPCRDTVINPITYNGKRYNAEEFEELSDETKEAIRQTWLRNRLSEYSLVITDEAHRVGADKTANYWEYIRTMCQNKELCVVGATATPLRTDTDVSLENDLFCYNYGKRKLTTRLKTNFDLITCWKVGLMEQAYYTKGILDTDQFKSDMGEILDNYYLKTQKDKETEAKRGRKSKAEKNMVIYSGVSRGRARKLAEERQRLDMLLANVRTPAEIILDATKHTAGHKVETWSYMRFLVFYQDTEDMIKYHEMINSEFKRAFKIGIENTENSYNNLNPTYLLTRQDRKDELNVTKEQLIEAEDITKRDEYIKHIDPTHGKGVIDLIHCINILNMGYHVGDVTGIIIKRRTGSEIIYYQQIGRAMSVNSDERPLIVDFENADSELFQQAGKNAARDEAVNRIQEFIQACEKSEDCGNLNNIYKMLNKHVDIDKIPNDMLEYFYYDRHMPIYFIKGIADSMHCSETLEALILRLIAIDKKKPDEEKLLQPDLNFVNFSRLHKDIIGTPESPKLIQAEQDVFINLKLIERGEA